jgi:1-aminocyclopropane-1-carboxylate deaminase/D-cysteine desulfhydrase-like pyridoxal-dependent ACC family enzyme
MRQLIWMVDRYRPGREHIYTGASVQSPQLSMTAIVGAHYGLPVTEVVYSKPHTLMGHPNPAIAAGFGAEFDYAKGPYNPIIQSRVDHLAALDPAALVVEYGISLPLGRYTAEEVLAFHAVGAAQTANMPTQVWPASCWA